MNGPVHVDIAGSGNVKIADGVADPLHVDILGAGDLYFGGMAVNPSISAMGSGNVHIKSYRGKLSNDGMADVQIGSPVNPARAHRSARTCQLIRHTRLPRQHHNGRDDNCEVAGTPGRQTTDNRGLMGLASN